MESDTPSASWHPAMMPNYHTQTTPVASSSNPEAPREYSTHSPEPSSATAPAQHHEESAIPETIPEPVIDEANVNKPSPLNAFDDDDPEAGAWDIGDDAPAEEAPPSQHAPDSEEATSHDQEFTSEAIPVLDSPAAIKSAKHSSTMSFTRTAHEVIWSDDDGESEFSLQRTETDPFNKFMSPSDRTNSFPPDEPPPATQAQDILHEIEQGDDHEATTELSDFPSSFEQNTGANGPSDEDYQQTMGRDMSSTGEEASETRFEEGLPLIPQTQQDEPPNGHAKDTAGFDDTFADDAADGDDFFSNIQDSTRQEVDDLDNFSLQRKDTSLFTETSSGPQATSTKFEPETPAIAEADDPIPDNQVAVDTQQAANGEASEAGETKQDEPVNLDAKWAEAFAEDEDEDFLLEDPVAESKELDPADFFGSDDEGFLEDVEDPEPQEIVPQGAAPAASGTNGRYMPSNPQPSAPQTLNTFNSSPSVSQLQQNYAPGFAHPSTAPPTGLGYGAPAPRPEMPKAQSFADKAKGGYSSPYDLPMEVVKPQKRASLQQLPRGTPTPSAPPVAPPRSTSMYNQAPPLPPPGPPVVSQSPPPPVAKTTPQLKSKPSFFEDLPMVSRPRPGSRHSAISSPGQNPYAPSGPPAGPPPGAAPPTQLMSPPPMGSPLLSPPGQNGAFQASPGVAGLVAPERVSPYLSLQSTTGPKPSAPANSRYSPAPPTNAAAPVPVPAAASRYSPAPPAPPAPPVRSGSGSYAPPPSLAHQPRTSSPLAHFEVSHDRHAGKLLSPAGSDSFPMVRSASSQFDPRLHRLSSLPTTQEVDEEVNTSQQPPITRSVSGVPPASARYSPQEVRRTPPPPMSPSMSNTLSPPKRQLPNYTPQAHSSGLSREPSFAPPPRSQTQSPGAMSGNRTAAIPRPSSVHGITSPRSISAAHKSPPTTRVRGMSQSVNLVAPTDGREKDPLRRWRGAPLISWGVGGTIVTSFPKDVPRYGMAGNAPMVIRSPGEVKIKHVKDIQPLDELLSKFPGPLKGKSKKKETVAWLTSGIELMDAALPQVTYQHHLSHEDKRAMERVLLLKILRVLVEHDGMLDGNPTVEKTVRQILLPDLESEVEPVSALAGATMPGTMSAATALQSDSVDSSAVEQIKKSLLMGEREKAVWAAADKRLWGHAMLIANTVTGDLYKQVAQEFVKKEVNQPGHSNESLAALYGVLSGNHEESVDELVPSHARAGLKLMSTSVSIEASKDELDGLDKWRETLGLILGNRSNADVAAITSLGNLLSSYGRAEAAHICFMFARQHAVFGGLDDPKANFVLVGADHKRQADQFTKETEALLLSEVYEYGLSLTGGATVAHGCPHLAAYKYQHAMTLAEYGIRDKALQYCDNIIASISSQTRRSPYYHHMLESAVDDLSKRLKLAPKEESSSWISKPSMNQVSNSMWSKFNKFVAGDENDGTADGAPVEGEAGPFSRITPNISRSPSLSNFGEVYGNGTPAASYGTPAPAPTNRAGSRYAPSASRPTSSPYEPSAGGYHPVPRSSMERTSGEHSRTSLDLPPQLGPSLMHGGYTPETNSTAKFGGYQPVSTAPPASSPYAPQNPAPAPAPAAPITASSSNPYAPSELYGSQSASAPPEAPIAEPKAEAPSGEAPGNSGYEPPSYGYEPPTLNTFDASSEEPTTNGGYEPPSYGFEPPSYEPGQDDAEEAAEKPKKKSIMDDDDDDIPALKKPAEKSKAEKDRENQELFRKAAEEDAKRAEAAKSQKKGWFGGLFGGGAKKEAAEAPKAVKANLGEASSFVYDPDAKRWVNKKAGADNTPAKSATPPPPRAASSRNSTPPPPGNGLAPPMGSGTPPPGPPSRSVSGLKQQMSSDSLHIPGPAMGGAPPMGRSVSNMSTMSNMSNTSGEGLTMAPPPRPATSLSNASSIDDLLGAAGPRKPGAKKARKGRYVDVMAK
ncbi:COPII coat assembly protein SEC16 [Apiospora rasikravindrae]|uniref:Protein transport protein sec16 n=1 Tax=Apiospora rasikravindrae TaxID=990691 RepID=A0ABR1SLS6_9PEZI